MHIAEYSEVNDMSHYSELDVDQQNGQPMSELLRIGKRYTLIVHNGLFKLIRREPGCFASGLIVWQGWCVFGPYRAMRMFWAFELNLPLQMYALWSTTEKEDYA